MCTKQLNQSGVHRISLMISAALLMASGSVFAQAPPNDDCVTATILDSSAPFPPSTDSVDATEATFNAADPQLSCNSDDGSQTVWYEYTPAASGLVNINTVSRAQAVAKNENRRRIISFRSNGNKKQN